MVRRGDGETARQKERRPFYLRTLRRGGCAGAENIKGQKSFRRPVCTHGRRASRSHAYRCDFPLRAGSSGQSRIARSESRILTRSVYKTGSAHLEGEKAPRSKSLIVG